MRINVDSECKSVTCTLQSSIKKRCFFLTCITVEPLIVDPPTKGHDIIDLSTKDTGQGPKNFLPYSSNTF